MVENAKIIYQLIFSLKVLVSAEKRTPPEQCSPEIELRAGAMCFENLTPLKQTHFAALFSGSFCSSS
jgi:hypothetical protein